MYRIEFNRRYLKDLETIPAKFRKQIIEKINELAVNPRPHGCKQLQGNNSPPLYRIRCGDYRIVYTIHDNALLIIVIQIGHRREVYN